jgi:tRNA threonylcarbamoyladenosine modification (KEOPS) complex  Pcc1 subunit
MKYSLKLDIKEEYAKELYGILTADEIINTKRAETKFSEDKLGIGCTITADDAVALKASFGSVVKALEIYEKAERLVKR